MAPSQRTLLDGDTGQKFDSLDLLAGAVPGGGGAVAATPPLFWLDPNTVIPGPRDGSLSKPFVDLDEVEASGSVPSTAALLLVPGDVIMSNPLIKRLQFNGFAALITSDGGPGYTSR